MSNEEEEQPTPPKDTPEQVIFPPNAEQAGSKLQLRVPPRKLETEISEVFGMLEREGRLPVTIEEMNEAVISKTAEDQERLNTARKLPPNTPGNG